MKILWIIICSCISATLFIYSFFVPAGPGWVHIALYVFSVVVGFWAFVLIMVAIDDRNIEVEKQKAELDILRDKELKRLELYTRIPALGWPYMMSERGLVVDARGSQPVTKVRLLFGEVPQDFIKDFISHRDPNFVRPVRYYGENDTWDDGGKCREYATICIRHILEKQYAGGLPNTPKKWVGNGRTQFQYEAGLGIKELK